MPAACKKRDDTAALVEPGRVPGEAALRQQLEDKRIVEATEGSESLFIYCQHRLILFRATGCQAESPQGQRWVSQSPTCYLLIDSI